MEEKRVIRGTNGSGITGGSNPKINLLSPPHLPLLPLDAQPDQEYL